MPHHAIARPVDGAFAVLHVFQKDGGKLALLTLKDEVGGQVAEPLRDGQRGLDESLVKPDVGILVRQDRNALDGGKAIEHENAVTAGGSGVVAYLYDLVLGQGQSTNFSAGIDFARLAGKSTAVDQQKLQFALVNELVLLQQVVKVHSKNEIPLNFESPTRFCITRRNILLEVEASLIFTILIPWKEIK